METLKLRLEPEEYRGLCELSERELRPLPDQIRHLIREALKRRGLLPAKLPPEGGRSDAK